MTNYTAISDTENSFAYHRDDVQASGETREMYLRTEEGISLTALYRETLASGNFFLEREPIRFATSAYDATGIFPPRGKENERTHELRVACRFLAFSLERFRSLSPHAKRFAPKLLRPGCHRVAFREILFGFGGRLRGVIRRRMKISRRRVFVKRVETYRSYRGPRFPTICPGDSSPGWLVQGRYAPSRLYGPERRTRTRLNGVFPSVRGRESTVSSILLSAVWFPEPRRDPRSFAAFSRVSRPGANKRRQ